MCLSMSLTLLLQFSQTVSSYFHVIVSKPPEERGDEGCPPPPPSPSPVSSSPSNPVPWSYLDPQYRIQASIWIFQHYTRWQLWQFLCSGRSPHSILTLQDSSSSWFNVLWFASILLVHNWCPPLNTAEDVNLLKWLTQCICHGMFSVADYSIFCALVSFCGVYVRLSQNKLQHECN